MTPILEQKPWEYHVELLKNPDLGQVKDRFNRLGSMGWELVSNVSTVKTWLNVTGNDLVFLFKRPGVGRFESRPEDEPGYVAH